MRPCGDFTLPENGTGATRTLAVLDASSPWAWVRVAGLSPMARLLYHLEEAGIRQIVIVVDGCPKTAADLHRRISVPDTDIRFAPGPWQALPFTDGSARDMDVFYVDASYIIDPRLISVLASANSTTALYGNNETSRDLRNSPAMLIKAPDVRTWRGSGFEEAALNAGSLVPGDIDPYSPRIRGILPPYVMKVENDASVRKAIRLLLRSQQKKVMDLPSRYFDPLFENWLTRLLCGTPVTPNIVTLFFIRMAGFSINYLTPAAGLGGEVTKGVLPAVRGRGTEAATGVILDKLSYALSQLPFVLSGAGITLWLVDLSTPVWSAPFLITGLLVFAVILFMLVQKHGKLGSLLRGSVSRRFVGGYLKTLTQNVTEIDRNLSAFYGSRRNDLLISIFWHTLGGHLRHFSDLPFSGPSKRSACPFDRCRRHLFWGMVQPPRFCSTDGYRDPGGNKDHFFQDSWALLDPRPCVWDRAAGGTVILGRDRVGKIFFGNVGIQNAEGLWIIGERQPEKVSGRKTTP